MNDETMMDDTLKQIQEDIEQLKSELAERKAALPAHSLARIKVLEV